MIKRVLIWAGYAIGALIGIFLYFEYPQVQTMVLFGFGTIFASRLMEISTKSALEGYFREDLFKMRERIAQIDDRTEETNRKVSALLRDALDRRTKESGR